MYFTFTSAVCYVHTQLFLALYICVFILNGFPLWLFLKLDSLLWNIVLEVSGPFYNMITRNYATNFNMNFLGKFLYYKRKSSLHLGIH